MRMIIRIKILILLVLVSATKVFGQTIPDTVYVWTDTHPILETVTKYYVINGNREMVIHITNEKTDTTFYDELSQITEERFPGRIREIKIRALPIEEIDADMVFQYFEIGESIESVTKRLGKKELHVYDSGFQVAFFNKSMKKNEIFDFLFSDGKLVRFGRPSTNTLPTNDVWEAFELVEIEQNLKDLNAAVEKLKAKKTKKSNQKKRAKKAKRKH